MRTPSTVTSWNDGSSGSPGGSVFPATARTGAMARSSSSTPSPTSPAWRIISTPSRAANTDGRTRPCVSEISPINRAEGEVSERANARFTRSSAPPARERVIDAQLVEDACDDEVDELLHRFGAMVEARRRRQDDGPSAREAQHVRQMNGAQRSLARYEHERPPLLEHDVGGALDQRSRRANTDGRQGTHGARADDHPGIARRSGGRSRAAVRVIVHRYEAPPRLHAHTRS